jgi:endonuclease YncB( thermonuclease family)
MMQMPEATPVFNAEFVHLVDADTVDVSLDRWMGDRSVKRLRLLGVNCPETRGPEREAGLAATEFAREWLVSAFDVPYRLVVQTSRYDRWGRILGRVWRTCDGAELSQALIDAGHGEAVSALAQIAEARGE